MKTLRKIRGSILAFLKACGLSILARLLVLKEKLTKKRLMIAHVAAGVIFFSLMYFGALDTPPVAQMPKDLPKLALMRSERLRVLIQEQPETISKVAFIQDMPAVVVYQESQSYLVSGVKTFELTGKLADAKIAHSEQAVNKPKSWTNLFGISENAELPAEVARLSKMTPERLDALVLAQPEAVSKVVFFNELSAAAVYVKSQAYLVSELPDLASKLDAAKIQHSELPTVKTTKTKGWANFVGAYLGFMSFLLVLGVIIDWRNKGIAQYAHDGIDDTDAESRRLSYNAPQSKDQMAKPTGKPLTWDDVGGNPEAIHRLRRIERFIKYAAWFKLCQANTPRGVLFLGPPGTGKTLLAKILAWVCDCNFMQATGSDFDEKLVGVGAGRWRKLVNKGAELWKKTGKITIIFIDEVECIAKNRAGREHTETLTAMLASIDGFATCPGVIFLAATNHPEILDPAFTRPGRFGDKVSIDPPDLAARLKIFQIKTRDMRLDSDVDLKKLATRTPGFTGAQIEQVCNEAAVAMAERSLPEIEGMSVEDMAKMPRLLTAVDFQKGIDYVMMGDELLSKMAVQTPEERRNIEIHEAGHAFVNFKIGGPAPASLSRIIRQKSLGVFTTAQEADKYGSTDKEMRGRICVFLGGLMAQKILLKARDTAPSDDLKQANRIARQMAGLYGMSDSLGYVSLPLDDLGHPLKPLGAELQNKFDAAWMKIVEECVAETEKIITEGKVILENLAKAMELKEKLIGDEITRICNGEDPELVIATGCEEE